MRRSILYKQKNNQLQKARHESGNPERFCFRVFVFLNQQIVWQMLLFRNIHETTKKQNRIGVDKADKTRYYLYDGRESVIGLQRTAS